jgi:outer membrane protein with beta-barrel domain
MQGAKYEEADFNDGFGNTSSYKSTINLNYINVPVMVKFYPIPKLFAELGPQVGFLISAKEKFEESGTEIVDGIPVSYDNSESVDAKDYFKSIDFGVNVGVGYEFTEMIFADLRYNIGLSDISEAPDDVDFDFGFGLGDVFKTKNNVLSLSVGFKF